MDIQDSVDEKEKLARMIKIGEEAKAKLKEVENKEALDKLGSYFYCENERWLYNSGYYRVLKVGHNNVKTLWFSANEEKVSVNIVYVSPVFLRSACEPITEKEFLVQRERALQLFVRTLATNKGR